MKLINNIKKVELIVDQSLVDKLGAMGIEHFPNEFGGFLIGKYSSDFNTLHINGFILPSKYKSFPYLFERSSDGLEKKLDKLFTEENQYYVGEWHTHPNGSTQFSQTDLNAMIEIGECETVYIKNPILLILSVSKEKLREFTFYLYDDQKLIAYE